MRPGFAGSGDIKVSMKLYIWADPYQVKYGVSMLLAVAESLEQAIAIADSARVYSYVRFESKGKNRSGMAIKLGEPTRVVDLPCAEWHEWCE